jgi:hypothetical protein
MFSFKLNLDVHNERYKLKAEMRKVLLGLTNVDNLFHLLRDPSMKTGIGVQNGYFARKEQHTGKLTCV